MRDSTPDFQDDLRKPGFTSLLDLARWLAAGLVFVTHLRDPLFFGWGHVLGHDRTLVVKLWFFVTGWAAAAVIVFFVLSGWLVGGSALARLKSGRFDGIDYAIDRVTRLFVAYWPALLLTLVLDMVGSHLFAGSGLYDHHQAMLAQKFGGAGFAADMTRANFFGSGLMLQTLWVDRFGSNVPLWTISLEFWFYASFGLAAAGWLSRRNRRGLWLAASLAALLVLLGVDFLLYAGLWCLGAAASLVVKPFLRRPFVALATMLALLIAARLEHGWVDASFTHTMLRDYLAALSFAWVLVSWRGRRAPLLARIAGLNKFMASFSYSLYLIHFPLMLFILGALFSFGHFTGIASGYAPTSGEGLMLYGCIIVLVYGAAWLFAALTEQQTWRVRRFLKSRLQRFTPPAIITAPRLPAAD